MTDFQLYVTLGVFASVILLIALDLIDMTVAALLGVSVLIVFGVLDGNDLMPIVHTAGGPLALLFGGMVVARVLDKTGVFAWLGEHLLHATGGSGKRLLLLVIALLLPLNAFLPNATVIILAAPIIIRVCQALEVDFVGPLIIAAIVSNAAGMLTLSGRPGHRAVVHRLYTPGEPGRRAGRAGRRALFAAPAAAGLARSHPPAAQ